MTKRLIYADNAATTPLLPEVWDEMAPLLKDVFGNPSSLHQWSKPVTCAIKEAREEIARCIKAKPEEIYFTSGGTESDNWVVKCTEGGILVSSFEHHAVLNAARSESRFGRNVSYVRPKTGLAGGYVTPENLSRAWRDDVRLVSIMTANNEIGTINPIRLLSDYSHKRGALFHTDAVQAVGHIPLDVREMGVDFLSASAHKFNGPKGVGFLYARKGLSIRPLMDGGQQERGLRAGTENVASIVGMAVALRLNCARMTSNCAMLNKLTSRFRHGIDSFCKNVIYLGEGCAERLPGFISISFPGHSAEGILHMLDLKGIAVSTGAACDSKRTRISHVLKSIKAPNEVARSTIRITFGPQNTEADVDAIVKALRDILTRRQG